jgi:hypothetical protein
VGTTVYQAPETFDAGETGYTCMADVYSTSLILYELLSGQKPLECDLTNNGQVLTLKQRDHFPKFPMDVAENVFSEIKKGYSLDPKKRPLLSELCSAVRRASKSQLNYFYGNDSLSSLGVQFRKGINYFRVCSFASFVSYYNFFSSSFRWNAGIYQRWSSRTQ